MSYDFEILFLAPFFNPLGQNLIKAPLTKQPDYMNKI